VAAALFSEACFDTLYVRDETGTFVASLAEHEPEVVGAEVRVTVREGLKTARGRPISARECAASIARARGAGLSGWLADVPAPRVEGSVLRFATKDPARLVRALASPLIGIVPFGFSPEAPDGTGPFRATFRSDGLVLARNPNAARGASFLDEIVVGKAQDLKASLRAFESGADDMGWLGMGLYEPRAGARPFDAGPVAYVGLFVGRDAGTWDSPGLAQRVCDSLLPTRSARRGPSSRGTVGKGPPVHFWCARTRPTWSSWRRPSWAYCRAPDTS
jgi:peptide/nickel transport system substrate-binding protein